MIDYVMDRLVWKPLSGPPPQALTYVCQDDGGWTHLAQFLEDAQQACQAVANGPLHWTPISDETWAAHDREAGTIYHIEHLPF